MTGAVTPQLKHRTAVRLGTSSTSQRMLQNRILGGIGVCPNIASVRPMRPDLSRTTEPESSDLICCQILLGKLGGIQDASQSEKRLGTLINGTHGRHHFVSRDHTFAAEYTSLNSRISGPLTRAHHQVGCVGSTVRPSFTEGLRWHGQPKIPL
ncbi:hypothetical protein BJV78DRAFT_572960 [Lactifluus subvellereus]|nr:hypothetical protein BJV78DRAFT_572960 [Lactifluus subvellereus]